MLSRCLSRGVSALACVLFVLAASSGASGGTATAGDLYFDNFRIGNPFQLFSDATVQKVHFNFDGTATFTVGTPTIVKDLGASGNADGLIFAPNGNLLIGGSTTGVIEQITRAGAVVGNITIGTTNPYHLTLSPDGTTIYSGGSTGFLFGQPIVGDNPGPLGVSPFFSNGTAHNVTGSETGITQIAFDASGHAYYTSSPDTGNGDVGTINLATYQTTAKITALPAAHGITFDRFTGDLIVSGNSHITQIDPTTFQVVSDLDLSSMGVHMLDQLYVDGRGHLFAGDNGSVNLTNGTGTKGKLVFIDYSGGSHQIGAASDFVATHDLVLGLDDIAPVAALQVGDANFDGRVGFDDLLILAQHYGQAGSWVDGDFNADGVVNFSDLLLLAQNYGQSLTSTAAPAAVSPVPEPASLGFLALGSLLSLSRRRR